MSHLSATPTTHPHQLPYHQSQPQLMTALQASQPKFGLYVGPTFTATSPTTLF